MNTQFLLLQQQTILLALQQQQQLLHMYAQVQPALLGHGNEAQGDAIQVGYNYHIPSNK